METVQTRAPRGVGARILGVVMIIVGCLDMMLFWRDGQVPSLFFVFLVVAGVALYAIGSFQNNRSTDMGDAG